MPAEANDSRTARGKAVVCKELLGCPFCNEQDFDATGLKIHLTAGHCEAFNNTSVAVPRTMARSGRHDPIRYYRCPKCEREFVAPPEGYTGLCKGCQQPNDKSSDREQ